MFTGEITQSRKVPSCLHAWRHGSAWQGDAYVWAINTFIHSGLCDATMHGYYIDYFWVASSPCCGGEPTDYQMSTVTNHDYVISRRGFFWDLDVWPDESPNDDPTQVPFITDLITPDSHSPRAQT